MTRRIVHLSDLHFGRHEPAVADALIEDLATLAPDLVAISGDLTQRARRHEFALARTFLDRIAMPVLVVPGNHDVPLYNVGQRLFRPLERFRSYICNVRQPVFADAKLTVIGLDTARALTVSGGRVSTEQMRELAATFDTAPASSFKIVVTHHPLMPPPGAPDRAIAGRAAEAVTALEAAGVDVLLAGHFHRSFTADLKNHHPHMHRSILVVHAGTATSTRRRNEDNTYNVIEIAPPYLTCRLRAWRSGSFAEISATRFCRRAAGWVEVD
jgi:3',5'-cyclic AMP phosphodiesterase CpdA